MKFPDGTEFSATNPQNTLPLTINVPIGLQYQGNMGNIQVKESILQVPSGKTLALVGGNVNVDGASLFAANGRIEIQGIGGEISIGNGANINVSGERGGEIAINARRINIFGENTQLKAGLLIQDPSQPTSTPTGGNIDINAKETITLAQKSRLENEVEKTVQGNGGNINITSGERLSVEDLAGIYTRNRGEGNTGNINITVNNLSVTGGSEIIAEIFGRGAGGNVTLNATDSATFDGESSSRSTTVASLVGQGAVAQGGNLTVNTRRLNVSSGAQISAGTLGLGNGGNITFNVTDSVSLDGLGKYSTAVGSQVFESGEGNAGKVRINTRSLSLTNSAQIVTNTQGRGNAGSIEINATDSVFLSGVGSNEQASGIGSQVVFPSVVGNAGSIIINTRSLSLSSGATLVAHTHGQGNAGNIEINATDVYLDGVSRNQVSGLGSQIFARAVGNGGNIKVNTRNLFVTNGAVLNVSSGGKGNAGNIEINAKDLILFDGTGSTAGSRVVSPSTGRGGKIKMNADRIFLSNGAVLNTNNQAQGTAGDIEITSRSLRLNNQAEIRASTISGNGGNIILKLQDLLLLRKNSEISTTAGIQGAGGNGGNITIDTPNGFVVAFPNENSDITANAFTGQGGKVQINTFGIFSIEPRSREDLVKLLGTNLGTNLDPKQLNSNDITAISQSSPNLNGTVNINTPDVDPSREVVNLPAKPGEPQLAQTCSANPSNNQSSFTITGRGGLPVNPSQPLTSNSIQSVDWISLEENTRKPTATDREQTTQKVSFVPSEVIEAQQLKLDSSGNIILVAIAPTTPQYPAFCQYKSR